MSCRVKGAGIAAFILASVLWSGAGWTLSSNACVAVYDVTAPVCGCAVAPGYLTSRLIEVAYDGFEDAGSGLRRLEVWSKQGTGLWTPTDMELYAPSGLFTYTAPADGPVAFWLRGEDNAGNTTPLPGSTPMAVTICDTTRPVVTLAGASTVTVEFGATWTDPGATAVDGIDGDISSRVVCTGAVDVRTLGTYTLSYAVSDTAGNVSAAVTRTVRVVDTTKPVITLNGTAKAEVTAGDKYVDAGATATDNYDGDISSRIQTSGLPIDTNKPGVHTVTYAVSDTSGNAATSVSRTVTVALPGIKLEWPVNGAVWHVSGLDSLPVTVMGTTGVVLQQFDVTMDGQSIGTGSSTPFTVKAVVPITYGPHLFTVSGRTRARPPSRISASVTVTITDAPAESDADGNGLPDNPFTQLDQSGDAWYASANGRLVGAVNLDGRWSMPLVLSFAEDGGGFVADLAVPGALFTPEGQDLMLFAMSSSLDALFGPAADGFRPEPEGYQPLSGNRYMAASVVCSHDGGQSYQDVDPALMAANPITLRAATLNQAVGADIIIATHPLLVDVNETGLEFLAGEASWESAMKANESLRESALTCDLMASAVVAVYERNELPAVDGGMPAVSITSPAAGQWVIEPNATITGTAKDEGRLGGLYAVTVWNDEGYQDVYYTGGQSAEWRFDVSLPALGLYTFYVQSSDTAGNLSPIVTVPVQYGAVGDVNVNGVTDSEDVNLIGRLAVMGEAKLNAYLIQNGQRPVAAVLADVNFDGLTDSLDATLLRRVLRIGLEATNTALAERGLPIVHVGEALPRS